MGKQRKTSFDAPHFAAAVSFVWAAYHHFLTRPEPPGDAEAKAFAGHHTAARSALGHLEQLLKLTSTHGHDDAADDIRRLIQQARWEIADLPPEEARNDDAG